jgi:hypothetical protein
LSNRERTLAANSRKELNFACGWQGRKQNPKGRLGVLPGEINETKLTFIVGMQDGKNWSNLNTQGLGVPKREQGAAPMHSQRPTLPPSAGSSASYTYNRG